MSFLRNLLMAVTALGAALAVAYWIGSEFGKAGVPFAFLGGLVAGYFIILLFRVWQPKRPSSPTQGSSPTSRRFP